MTFRLALALIPALFGAKLTPISLDHLHPCQFAVGFRAVEEKVAQVKAAQGKPRKFDDFLERNAFPAILGPKRRIYIQDHHHLGIALLKRGVRKGYYSIDADWSGLSEAEFWAKMEAENKVYLRDETGALRQPEELPTRLDALADDPYRSLAYFVKERGGFLKSKQPFAEFLWAEFFRYRIRVGTSDGAFEAAVRQGVKWARHPEAASLPGYLGPKP